MAAAIVVWTFGDVYWLLVLNAVDSPPIPSPADIGYLLFVPFAFAGLLGLLHARVPNVSRTVLVDAIIVALAAATVGAALVLEPVAAHATGGTLAVATNLAYPISDLVLLAVIVAAVALRGWRLDMTWGLLGVGVLMFCAADCIYLVTSANGTYTEPNLYGAGWVGSTVLLAAAAWAPLERQPKSDRLGGTRDIVLPLALAFIALLVTMLQPPDNGHAVTLILGIASTTAVMVRRS